MEHPDYSAHGYLVEAVLGSNPEAGRTAYRGREVASGRPVVIKRFSLAGREASWETYQAHQREIEVLQDLDHPRIPEYVGDFQTDDGFCLVQRFCEAPPMSERRTWSLGEVRRVARSLLELLVYLQDRVPPVVHRDLKPENILVDERCDAHLVDFGLARTERAQATTMAVGTPGFMPPEQLLGQAVTDATDLYGAGASLIAALTGTPSNRVGSLVDSGLRFDLSKLPRHVPPGLRRWLGRMVEPALAERFANASEALEALRVAEAEDRRPAAARKASKPTRRRPMSRRRPESNPNPKPAEESPAVEPPPRAGGRFLAVVATVAATALGALFYFMSVATPGSGAREAPEAVVTKTTYCRGPMTLERDIDMYQATTAIEAQAGCDLTVRNATIRGKSAGIVMAPGAKVRVENVTFETSYAIRIKGGEATIRGSRMRCSWHCVDVSGGELTIKDTTAQAQKYGATVYKGTLVATGSSCQGGKQALAIRSGRATLRDVTLKSASFALLGVGGDLTIEGGHIEGGIAVQPKLVMKGLETASITLGAAAGDTWAGLGCAPIDACVRDVGVLGEYVLDLRVAMHPDGTLGELEYLQTKADDRVKACVEERLAGVTLPGADGEPHTLRCTTNGSLMAGGGGMRSSDYRLEDP